MPGPQQTQQAPSIDSRYIGEILGEATARLIELIAKQAQARQLSLFLVGGVIRDLLLKRRNFDLDLVLESDAIAFAEALSGEYGGALQSHRAFGTATWTLDASVAERLSLPADDIPSHLDFARARAESYARPAALPTVTPSSIERDLRRRDFSLNTVALQLSPAGFDGKLLDVCGGLRDLELKQVRVLHDRSFLDDPTRILRALRFARRYGFELEPETAALIKAALPLLGSITGIRLSHEIELILQEAEAAKVIQDLQDLGALERIHPAFRVSRKLEQRLNLQPDGMPRWAEVAAADPALRWSLLLVDVGASAAADICERLDLTQALTRSVSASAKLVTKASALGDAGARPSEIAQLLESAPEVSLVAAWIALSRSPAARQNIDDYAMIWRHQRPRINGNDLKRMGIPPGPRYKYVLEALRSAWIDGDIKTPEEEALYLKTLLANDN